MQLIKEVSTFHRYVNMQYLRMSTERSHHHDKPASQRLTTRGYSQTVTDSVFRHILTQRVQNNLILKRS